MGSIGSTINLRDGVTTILTKIDNALYRTISAFDRAGNAADAAAAAASASVNHWTGAVGNYDKSALSALYTTEELVQMGYMSADALETAADAAEDAAGGLEEASNAAEDAARSIEESGNAAASAANGGHSDLLQSLKKLAAGYFSLKTAADLVSGAMTNETYALRFKALMGDDIGNAAAQWAKSAASDMGRAIPDVMESTLSLSKIGFSGANIQSLTGLTDRLAWFTGENDYSGISEAIQQAFRTGRTDSLSSALDLSTNALEGFGITEAVKLGDTDAFIAGLTAAAEAAGMTAEALEGITSGSEAQWGQFTNNIKNYATDAASGFLEAFAPTFEQLNEWLQSDTARSFFDGLSVAFLVAGSVASLFANILMGVADWISSNWTVIAYAAAVAVGIFAVQMLIAAASTIAANLPLVLFIALVAAVGLALQSMGVTAADVFGAIGVLAGTLYAVLHNGVAALYNIVAAFAEFLANVFNDPLGAIARLFFDVFDSILGIVETVASAIDFVLGTNMSGAVSGFRSNMKDWVSETFGENAIKIERMAELDVKATAEAWGEKGYSLGEKLTDGISGLGGLLNGLDDFDNWSGTGVSDYLSDISGSTSNIESAVTEVSEELLKYFRDIAEREVINRFTTAEITIEQHNENHISKDTDLDSITDVWAIDFAEKLEVSAEGVHE